MFQKIKVWEVELRQGEFFSWERIFNKNHFKYIHLELHLFLWINSSQAHCYCFSRILTACFNSSLLWNLFVAIFSLPNFIWVALWQSNVVSAASSTVVHYQNVPHFKVRKANFHLGFSLIFLLCTWEERLSELNVYLKKFWRKFQRKCVSEEISQLWITLCLIYLLLLNV